MLCASATLRNSRRSMKSNRTPASAAFVENEGYLRKLHIAIQKFSRQSRGMIDGNIIYTAGVFVLAGLTKGVIGLGLPTISMGLLAVVMAPVDAAAILVLPSFVTNVWQMVAGPSLVTVVRRLWPMMLGVCVGTWLAPVSSAEPRPLWHCTTGHGAVALSSRL